MYVCISYSFYNNKEGNYKLENVERIIKSYFKIFIKLIEYNLTIVFFQKKKNLYLSNSYVIKCN